MAIRRLQKLFICLFMATILMGSLHSYRGAERFLRAVVRELPLPAGYEATRAGDFLLLSKPGTPWGELLPPLLRSALTDLIQQLPDYSPKPIVVRIHEDQESLKRTLGGRDVSPTLGAYYLGRVELLSPKAWQPDLPLYAAIDHYSKEGPLVHELTHLLFDYLTLRPYPLWFTEGLAQYYEQKLRGCSWADVDNSAAAEITHLALAQLDDQGLSEHAFYLNSLMAVNYLQEALGQEGIQAFYLSLRQGKPFSVALKSTLQELAYKDEEIARQEIQILTIGEKNGQALVKGSIVPEQGSDHIWGRGFAIEGLCA